MVQAGKHQLLSYKAFLTSLAISIIHALVAGSYLVQLLIRLAG